MEPEDDFDDWIDDLYGMMQLINPPPCLSHAAIDYEPDSDTTTTVYAFTQQMSGPAGKIPEIIPPSYNLFPRTDPTIRMDAQVDDLRRWLVLHKRPAGYTTCEWEGLLKFAESFWVDCNE